MTPEFERVVREELNKCKATMGSVDDPVTDKQYCELYAVQQALTWVLTNGTAASPFSVVGKGINRAELDQHLGVTPKS